MLSNQPRRIAETLVFLVLGFLPISEDGPLNLFGNLALAQDQTLEEIFKSLSQLSEETGSYHADVTTVTKRNGKTMVTKGKVKFKWPNMRWQENRFPKKEGFHTAYIISNGSIRWNYMPSLNIALKYNEEALDADARLKGWLSADYFKEGSFQYVGRERVGKDEMHVFEAEQSALRKLKNDKQPRTMRIYFNAKNGILQKFIEYDQNGIEVGTQTFSNIQLDASISAKDFDFTPPEGTQIQEVKDVGPRTNPEKVGK